MQKKISLNLFVALEAIINSKTLTEAANSLHVTQSAMSTSLRKLREHFDNPLVSYSRARTEYTPLAEALRPRVAEMIQMGRDMLRLREEFNPVTSRAIFRLAATDAVEIVLLPHLLHKITKAAPHVSVISTSVDYSKPGQPVQDDFDVTFVVEGMHRPELQREIIFSDVLVGIVRTGHTVLKHPLDVEHYRLLPQASVGYNSFDALEVPRKGFQAAFDGVETAVTTSSFAAVAYLVARTNLVAVIPRRVARIFASSMPIHIFELPFTLPEVRIMAQWRAYKATDPAMSWLLTAIRETALGIRDDRPKRPHGKP